MNPQRRFCPHLIFRRPFSGLHGDRTLVECSCLYFTTAPSPDYSAEKQGSGSKTCATLLKLVISDHLSEPPPGSSSGVHCNNNGGPKPAQHSRPSVDTWDIARGPRATKYSSPPNTFSRGKRMTPEHYSRAKRNGFAGLEHFPVSPSQTPCFGIPAKNSAPCSVAFSAHLPCNHSPSVVGVLPHLGCPESTSRGCCTKDIRVPVSARGTLVKKDKVTQW